MSDDRKTTDEDAELFRRTVGSVKPIDWAGAETRRPRPRPVPARTIAENRSVLRDMIEGELDPAELETGEELIWRAPGLQERQFRKLRRGQFATEGQLDLHGMTSEEAREAVADFLGGARRAGRRCVRIIHGKGRGSRQGKPVLKLKLHRWLRQRADVLGFCSARAVDGGTGAVYVLLAKG
jgi:DNA-nicking Smr family endonuclease